MNFVGWIFVSCSKWNHGWSQSRRGWGLNFWITTFVFVINIELKREEGTCLRAFYWPRFMQYSIFGSILTIGAMIGAIISGRIADYAGRRAVSLFNFCVLKWKFLVLFHSSVLFHFGKQAMGFSEVFCIWGWLAIAFSKVNLRYMHSHIILLTKL